MNDICVIVRSVHERTEEACLQIVRSQLGTGGPFYVVRDRPFAEAHIESMRLAVEASTRWSLFLDGDVLLKRDAIAEMFREAESAAVPFYMLNFRVLDREYGGPAHAGVHFYATEHLSTALQFEGLAYEAQRPESRLCVEMARQARVPTLGSTRLVGLHGYEQFYSDIYRTAFVRAIKSRCCLEHLLRRCRSLYSSDGEDDQDDKVMFWGLVDGMLYGFEQEKAPLEKDFYQERVSQLLSMLGLEEKGRLALNQEDVDQVLREHVPDAHYLAIQRWVCSPNPFAVPIPDRSLRKRLYRLVLGVVRRTRRAMRVILYG